VPSKLPTRTVLGYMQCCHGGTDVREPPGTPRHPIFGTPFLLFLGDVKVCCSYAYHVEKLLSVIDFQGHPTLDAKALVPLLVYNAMQQVSVLKYLSLLKYMTPIWFTFAFT